MTVLSQWPSSTLAVVCDVCDKRDIYQTCTIMAATPGHDTSLADLLANLVSGCERRRVRYLEIICAARLTSE
jgi:hypothetical protein